MEDFDVSAAIHAAYVEGENAALNKTQLVEVAGEVTVREFPARSWSAQQAPVTEQVSQVASAYPARTRLLVTNTGADTVFLSPEQTACTPSSGYPLAAGKDLVFVHTGPVYACTATTKTSTLGLVAESRDGGT